MYWTDEATSKIQRAHLDGSDQRDLLTGGDGLSSPLGIAIDPVHRKMYFTDYGTSKIQRADLDGNNVEDLLTDAHGLYWPVGITLDVPGGKMYWTDSGTDKIYYSNLDDDLPHELHTGEGGGTLRGIALDLVHGKMYWTDHSLGKIWWANLDGSNAEPLILGLGAPDGISVDVEGGKIYWTDFVTDDISCADLDGTNVVSLCDTGDGPRGIVLDTFHGKLYWTDWGSDEIARADLPCSSPGPLPVTGLDAPGEIDIFFLDCNFNGLPDDIDIEAGTSLDSNTNGIPDECEPYCVGNELFKLLASDGVGSDYFGSSVSIDGDIAVVGAHFNDTSAQDAGTAYVFQYDGSNWVEVAKLLATDGAVGDWFGVSVSISGDVIVVGASGDNNSTGAAYVFVKPAGGWADTLNEDEKLIALDHADGDVFGCSVTISGDVAVIGAYGDDDNGPLTGSAYVFERDDNGTPGDPSDDIWTQLAKLTASDAAGDDRFGTSVSISSDVVVIGTPHTDEVGGNSGSAYVFEKPEGGWQDMTAETAKLTASDAADGDKLGGAVSISSDVAVIGACEDDDGGSSTGSAYVFVKLAGGWEDMNQTAKLTASDAFLEDRFGQSVSISGDMVIIGAPGHTATPVPGSAYVFEKPAVGWINMTETVKLIASDGAVGDYFGSFVSISSDMAVVGAPFNDAAVGAAYVFHGLSDCNTNGVLDICDIAEGTSQDCQPNGVPDECDIADCDPGDPSCQDCNTNGVPDDCDISTGTSEDTNTNGIPDECEDCNDNGYPDYLDILYGGYPDCDSNWIPDECDILIDDGGLCDPNDIWPWKPDDCSEDCQSNAIPDECEVPPICPECPDCNTNGVPDECEPDCNTNSIPDECDLRDCDGSPWCDDCNTNDMLDICDVWTENGGLCDSGDPWDPAGCSRDCNGGGIPDECEMADCPPDTPWCDDCQPNGVLDICDIDPTDPDRNGDVSCDFDDHDVPDECQEPPICLGDSNCDGVVNWRDIDYFVAAMNNNIWLWEQMFDPPAPPCQFANNDVNGDCVVNWRDIDPFVALMNTTCP
ncbi:MAG: hypothetical protein KAY37_14320 [Phycisphaerae bacterium]|nr:hypothetical protein [Phycisphaerae bacterium]